MTRRTLCLLAALFPLAIAQTAIGQERKSLAELDAYVESAMKEWGVPGLSLAVVEKDRVVLAKGYGRREKGKEAPVTADTLFAIASNTKIFTATAVGMLVAQGKLAWDTPVLKYMPDFQLHDPVATRKITVRDLLCHRCGLPTWGGDLIWFGSSKVRSDVIERIRHIKPAYDFRTGYGYSNLMFLVAGELIPQVSRQTWDSFIDTRIFTPLGMERSNTSILALKGMEDVAMPHTEHEGKVVTISYGNVDNAGPAGSINSSASEMARWLRLQLGNGVFDGKRIVPAPVIAETRRPHNLLQVGGLTRRMSPTTHLAAYGLGMGLRDYQGRLLALHTGGLDGMYSIVAMVPEAELGVVVLTNKDDHSLQRAIAMHLLDAFLGVPSQDWNRKYRSLETRRDPERMAARRRSIAKRIEGTKPSLPLAAYAGSYGCKPYGKAQIELKDGALELRLLSHPYVGRLSHWHGDVFMARWTDPVWNESAVFFDLNGRGEIGTFRIRIRPEWIDPVEYRFQKR